MVIGHPTAHPHPTPAYPRRFVFFDIFAVKFPTLGLKIQLKYPHISAKLKVKCPTPQVILTVILSVRIWNCG
jgi:hypothetical protein